MTDEELYRLIESYEGSAMKARLREFLQLPEDQREAAVAALTKAYEPIRDDLRSELERNFDLATQAAPEGQVAGNNPFSIYVGASPLEHLAVGAQKYKAGKDMRANREALDTLSKEQSEAQKALKMALMRDMLRNYDPQKPRFMTPEEEERWKRYHGTGYGT